MSENQKPGDVPSNRPIVVPEEIQTERLVLRRHSIRNGFGVHATKPLARVIFEAVDGDRERLGRYLPWVDFIRTEGDEEAYLRRCEEAWDAFELFDFGIYFPTGEFVGNCGLHTVSKSNRRAEIGYWVVGELEGKGIISEAVLGLTLACFKAGFHRLEIRCNDTNERSAGVPERIGYRLEGTLREDCFEKGVWRNTRIYGALASEF